MTTKNIIRAWKDAEYRNSLTDSERASLPANPAGSIELKDVDLEGVTGGNRYPSIGCTFRNCPSLWTKCW
jgi:mersacidin/lichenicidin family type 2 lantibiotic